MTFPYAGTFSASIPFAYSEVLLKYFTCGLS